MEEGRNTQTSAGDPLDGEPKIGRILEQTRRDRGLSLDEVEQATKIRKRYLTGLEREDYAMLPDAVYAQGFLKTYANFLGLDGEGLSRQVRNRRKPRRERGLNYSAPKKSDFERPLLPPGGVTGNERPRVSKTTIVTLVVAFLVVAGLLVTLYRVGQNSQSPGPPGTADRRGTTAEGGRITAAETENVAREDASGVASSEALRVEIGVEGAPS
jgi:cytoskeletal protein RodZ